MSRGRILSVAAAAVVLATSGWWVLGGTGRLADGEVVLNWSGAHTGFARLPGTIAWCPVSRTGTLEAISADTGLMVSLFEVDSLSAGVHPATDPRLRDQAPRPGSVAALRWVDDTALVIRGFQSASGLVDLRRVGAAVSGVLDLRMRSAAGTDTLVVRAEFRALPVTTGAVGCP